MFFVCVFCMFNFFYVVIVILYVLLCCHVRRNEDTQKRAVSTFMLYFESNQGRQV